MQYQMPPVRLPQTGVQQSYTFQTTQSRPPVATRSQPVQADPSVHGTSAAVVQPTYVFPVSQPLNRRSYRVKTGLLSIKGDAARTSFTTELTVFPLLQPARYHWALTEAPRYRKDVEPALHLGTVPSTSFDPISQVAPSPRYWVRQTPSAPTVPILGAPAAPIATDVFRFIDAIPPNYYGVRPAPRLIVRVVQGAVLPVPNPPALSEQPTARWTLRLDTSRLSNVPAPSVTGATSQATFLFPVPQPTVQWYARRAYPAPEPRLESPAPQQLSLFPVTQPEPSYYVERRSSRLAWTDPQLRTQVPVTAPQTYIFDVSQPTLRPWTTTRIQRTPDFHVKQTTGVVEIPPAPQTYIFDLTQSTLNQWSVPRVKHTFDLFSPSFAGLSVSRTIRVEASQSVAFSVNARATTTQFVPASSGTRIAVDGSN